MSFQSGRVTYCQFHHATTGPAAADEALLDALVEHRFRETEIGAPNEVEVGWITGEHLFDTRFSFEKNLFGKTAVFAMRMDTHTVPSILKQAYKTMHTNTAAESNPSGFASRQQKKEASQLAADQLQADLAAGRFRKSKMVPIAWDLATKTVYCGAVGNTVSEKLASLFKQTFDLQIEPVSAGPLAMQVLTQRSNLSGFETLRPSGFTGPPAKASANHEDAGPSHDLNEPIVPWVAKAGDMKDFLGNEFAIWLWHRQETAEGRIPITTEEGETEVFIVIDKTLDMDCAWDADGKQTLRGGAPTLMNEATAALRAGKWPRKLGLIVSDGHHQWELTLQADRMIVSAAQLPEITEADGPRDLLEQRLLLTRNLDGVLQGLYGAFLDERTQTSWPTRVQKIRQWIGSRRQPAKPATTTAS